MEGVGMKLKYLIQFKLEIHFSQTKKDLESFAYNS